MTARKAVDDGPLPEPPPAGSMQTVRIPLDRLHDWLEEHDLRVVGGDVSKVVYWTQGRNPTRQPPLPRGEGEIPEDVNDDVMEL
jgi:hypothetical protein